MEKDIIDALNLIGENNVALKIEGGNEFKTLSEQMKEFGVKNKKEFSGYYVYIGRNFNAKFNSAECETKWWEVDLYSGDVDKRVYEQFYGYNRFDTKNDVVWELLNLDKRIEDEK